MKKLRVLSVLFSIMFIGTSFIACAGGADDELDEEVPATAAEEAAADTSSTRQQQIDNAAAGSTVTLNTSFTDTSITITKALTVNGNGISGLTVTVNSNVTSNVTLKNFVRANIVVKPVSATNNNIRSARSARSAFIQQPVYSANTNANANTEHFEKMGEDALPLKLEGCSIEKFDAEADVALYMESGDSKKSEIGELNLKAGVEEFTFIEMDKADKPETTADEKTPTADKSLVGELNIQGNDVEKINLIGGKFDDVNIADGFTGDAIDFKYDEEFADQFADFSSSEKTAFFNNSKIAEKDVGVVEVAAAQAAGDVYKFEIPVDDYMKFDGLYTIVFMTDAQKTALQSNGWIITSAVANIQNPIYAAIPTGTFKIDFEGDKSKPLTIFGSEGGYIDYAAAFSRGLPYYERQDVIVLENYRNYNKKAFIAEADNTYVTIYVNMAEVRKEDIVICARSDNEDYGEAGTKLTEISLAGYKPYISLNWGKFYEEYQTAHPYPQSSLTDEEREQIVNLDNGDLDTVNTPAAIVQKINDDATAAAQWETNYASARSFALSTAIKSTNSTVNYNQPISSFIPYGSSLKLSFEFEGTFTPMLTATSYPNVSNVTPTVKQVQGTNVYQQMLDNWQD